MTWDSNVPMLVKMCQGRLKYKLKHVFHKEFFDKIFKPCIPPSNKAFFLWSQNFGLTKSELANYVDTYKFANYVDTYTTFFVLIGSPVYDGTSYQLRNIEIVSV